MPASVQIASAVRTSPAPAAGLPVRSRASAGGTFQGVLEQYHPPSDADSESAGPSQNSVHPQQNPKSSRLPGASQSAALSSKTDSPKTDSSRPDSSNMDAESAGSLVQTQDEDTPASAGASSATAFRRWSLGVRPSRSLETNDVGARSSQPTTNLTGTVAAPFPLTPIAEPHRPIAPLTSSLTLRQSGAGTENGAATEPVADALDAELAVPVAAPQVHADQTAAAGGLAFAARLSSGAEAQSTAPEPPRSADSLQQLHTELQSATQSGGKQIAAVADPSSYADSGTSEDHSQRQDAGGLFAKHEPTLESALAPVQTEAATPPSSDTPARSLSMAPHAVKVIDPPETSSSTNHDITIRIPDATDQGTAVRFVERAGEVHVSVRTSDTEMAQTLRGGLNDLVTRLQDGGIQTEVWHPGSDTSSPQEDLHQPFANPDGSNGNSSSSGSNSEQETNQQNKPRWVDELEDSIGNHKEISQLWQA